LDWLPAADVFLSHNCCSLRSLVWIWTVIG